MSVPETRRELVVFGVGGADTKLLAETLAQHEALTMVPATQFPGAEEVVAAGVPNGLSRSVGAGGWIADGGAALPLLPEVARVMENAMFIAVLRDVRDVLLDALEAGGPDKVDPSELAKAWLDEVQTLLEFERSSPSRVVKLAFEDLMLAPRTELVKLCVACELPGTAADLAASVERSKADRTDSEPRWLSALPPSVVIRAERVAQPTLSLVGYAPIDQWHELAVLRLKANRYDQLRRELELLQLEASSHDALRRELAALRAQVRELDGADADLRPGSGRDGSASDASGDEPWRAALEAELAALRLKTERYEALLDEVKALRYKAKQFDDLSESLPTLRYRSQKHDELLQENLVLRGKARRYDELRRKLAPLFVIRRLVRRIGWRYVRR